MVFVWVALRRHPIFFSSKPSKIAIQQMYNPNFNYGEFAIIKSQAGLNSYKLSVKEWVEKTNSIGIFVKKGRHGGTYAHKDIAFEFASAISPVFKLYLIKEFQRLKEEENNIDGARSITRAVEEIAVTLGISNENVKALIDDMLDFIGNCCDYFFVIINTYIIKHFSKNL